MKRLLLSLILTGSLLLSSVPVFAEKVEEAPENHSTASDFSSEYEEGTVLVTLASPKKTSLTKEGQTSFDPRIKVEEAYDLGDAASTAKTEEQKEFLSDKTLYVSEVSSDSYSTSELIDELDDQAYVVSVEPDYVQHLSSVSDDAYSDEQWYLDSGSKYSGGSTGISYSFAKQKTKTGTPVIAVMDTGINYEHEDLADHMWINPYLSKGLSGIYGYDFTENNAYCMDVEGHGTHCAGIIAAAADNQKGIAGISGAKLMALKVFDAEGTTTNSTIIKALNYIIQAKQAGVNIAAVNCSWGGGESGYTMPQLVQKIGSAGTLFVFASGNDGINHDTSELSCPYDLYRGTSPSENRNYIIITGASDPYDNPADFSDYGKQDVDLFAPGSRILSTYIEDTYFAGIYDSSKETRLTQQLLSFDTENESEKLYTDDDLGISTEITDLHATYLSDTDYRESSDSGSLLWSFDLGDTPSAGERSTYLYLDVTEEDPDVDADYYVSMLLGTEETEGTVTWNHIVKKSSGNYGSEDNRFYQTSDGRIYFKILGIVLNRNATGTLSYYVDDIGISVADPDPSEFGQYELMNGTSMAAPMVSGALGLLNEVYPDDTVTDRRNRLLTCVRTTGTVSQKCMTGGILDLSKMDSYTPSQTPVTSDPASSSTNQTASSSVSSSSGDKVTVKKVKIASTAKKTYTVTSKSKSGKTKTKKKTSKVKIKNSKITLRAGNKLKLTASITPKNASNKKIKWSSSRKKWASITQKGIVTAKKKGRGHTVKITAAARDGSGKKATVKIAIKK